jgi:hypothetical protein
MGFLDRFTSTKKPASAPVPAAPSEGATEPPASGANAPVKPRLVAARERLEANDLAGALAIYEPLLAASADRADVLVTISGDLGAHGHVAQIIELVAPRYDAERHGPATGLNLLQAYLAVRDPDSAQHVLDILFSLNRPELEDRLHGFSNAIAEQLAAPEQLPDEPIGSPAAAAAAPKVALISISKPIWWYGLENVAPAVLPEKGGRLRRIAFAHLALPGYPKPEEVLNRPEDELGRLSRGLPLWFAETFSFSAAYAPIAAVGLITPPESTARPMIFTAEWTTENLRQLVETSDGLDYIVTGAVQAVAGDYELSLRLYEVKSYRERKRFTARWTPGTADAELAKLHAELRRFMEWSPAAGGLAYAGPASPRAWIDTLGASLGLFLAEKQLLGQELLPPIAADVAHAGQHAASGEAASLAYLTLRARAAKLGVATPGDAPLAASPLVTAAQQALG